MSDNLRLLLVELDMIKDDEIIEPDAEDIPEDIYVGEMTNQERKLYTLKQEARRAAAQSEFKLQFNRLDEDQKVAEQINYARAMSKADLLDRLFWFEVNDQHRLWDIASVGVRRGFKVVKNEAETGPDIGGFMRHMFGL